MEIYRHTQLGTLNIVFGILGILVVIFVYPGTLTEKALIISGVALVVLLFISLTVVITPTELLVYFGIGIIRKKIELSEIAYCTPSKINIFYGWGIKRIPGGWMYNVSGLKVVDLKFKNGKKFYIGTDEPEKVCEIIHQLTGANPDY